MRFTKMHGLGNSYIYVDVFEETLEEHELPRLARQVADKNKGIGSDGLILIGPSTHEDVKMQVFNADGSEAKNCGNGLRCTAKYAYEHGYVNKERFTIETLGGTMKATVHPDNTGQTVSLVTIDMGAPAFEWAQVPVKEQGEGELSLEAAGRSWQLMPVSMGNPHGVIFVDDTEQAPVETVGAELETHEAFPEGANIEFVHMRRSDVMDFRVWERGSGITQACGTGACAAVAAAVAAGKSEKDKEVTVHLPGGDLYITWQSSGNILMTGNAEVICTGDYETRRASI